MTGSSLWDPLNGVSTFPCLRGCYGQTIPIGIWLADTLRDRDMRRILLRPRQTLGREPRVNKIPSDPSIYKDQQHER